LSEIFLTVILSLLEYVQKINWMLFFYVTLSVKAAICLPNLT